MSVGTLKENTQRYSPLLYENTGYVLLYGMSKFKLSDNLGISVEDADKMIKDYFKATPKLNGYLRACREYGLNKGFIRCAKPYSIIRYFPEWNKELNFDFKIKGSIERCSMNTPIQGAGSQMCKRALALLRGYIIENKLSDKVYIVMTVHDQIDCEVIEDYAEEWSKIQKRIMEEAGAEIIKSIPVLSEITISDKWSK